MSLREIAEKILNCKTYNTTEIQTLARAYLDAEAKLASSQAALSELEKECEGLKQQECMNCGAWLVQSDVLEKYSNKMIDELKLEITKLKKSREGLRTALENTWPGSAYAIDVDAFNRNALKADDDLMKEGEE